MQTPPHPSPSLSFGQRVTGCSCSPCFCSLSSLFHLFFFFPPTLHIFNCILLVSILSSLRLYQHSLPLFLCPSLPLPRACLSGSVPVCLFADDSTWSRCDAQQLLLCSAAASLPHPTRPSLPSPPRHIPLCLPSYVLIYLHAFFVPPLRRC